MDRTAQLLGFSVEWNVERGAYIHHTLNRFMICNVTVHVSHCSHPTHKHMSISVHTLSDSNSRDAFFFYEMEAKDL